LAHPEPRSTVPIPGTVALAASLAAVAGCLDAISLARLTGTFVAFQSGNTVLAGLELGRGEWSRAWPPLVAVLAYVVGSALTPLVTRAGDSRRDVRRRLFAGAVGFLALDAVIVLVGFGTGAETPTGFWRYAGIVAATFAMALQTAVVRTVDGVPVSSTFSSGMLVRLGQAFGELRHPESRPGELRVVRILGVVNLAFLAGAVVGGVVLTAWDNLAILVPLAALPVIAIWSDRSEPRASEAPG
jgi:uncharacterized membrane protein YoaK (UPF0700 family)